MGTLLLDDGNNSIILTNTVNKSEESFAIKSNIKSSFHITFSGFQRAIYIGNSLYNYNYDNESDFSDFTNESYPFYISEPDSVALNANITNLCISTGSFSPTLLPTPQPTIIPTFSPTFSPTETQITTTLYSKIDCYTEYGSPGDTSIYCSSKPNYIIISCGIIKLNGININDIIFYKGIYIERHIINDLTTDGICYINYNILNKNITQYIQPQARCCNFEQQYNDKFKCRYFKSDVDRINNQQSTERAAEASNETTYTTCPDKFPLLLSCNTILNEQNRITAYAQTNNDIQFYGSFYAHSANSDGEYNPDNNLYFELNTGINSSKSIPFPPTSTTTSTSRIIGSTPSPTYTPTSSRSILQLNISSTTHCVSQYGPIKGNYTISSIATCCTESYDTSSSDILQPTSSPTTSPTMRSPLETQLIGTNGTNTGEFYIENKASDSIIIGINTWGIYQVIDTNTINGTQYKIYYQGILIGSYLTMDANGIIETKFTSSDFAAETNNFYTITSCAGFILDIDSNGNRDYINGYDVYYTHIAIYGITFYTSFGRQYSCPDHQEFKDTSLQFANSELCDGKGNGCGQTIAETYYDIIKISERNIFAINGTYKLSGWKGWLQTRTLGPGVIRSVYGSIHFLFIGNATINTLSPTISPTPTPTSNKINTLSPTFVGQEESESLKCYTIWGNKQIECKNPIYDSMFGCNGYSVEGQIFNIYINNTNGNDKCIVETINNKPAAAIGTCCYFYQIPPRNFQVLIWTSVISGSMFFALFIFMTSCLFFYIKNVSYFEDADVDDDRKNDAALENVGEGVASDIIAQFKVTERDHAEMIELARKNSISVGLQI